MALRFSSQLLETLQIDARMQMAQDVSTSKTVAPGRLARRNLRRAFEPWAGHEWERKSLVLSAGQVSILLSAIEMSGVLGPGSGRLRENSLATSS